MLGELQMHVRARILYAAIVNDKTEEAIELRRIDSDIVVSAVSVVAGDEVIGVAKVAVGIGGGEEWKESPVRIISVWAMVMNARLAPRNGRIGLLEGGRLRGVQDVASGELPVFFALRCGIDEFVGPGVFGVAVVNDDAYVLRGGSDAHVEEGAETVASGDLHGPATEVRGVFGGVAESVDSPAHILAVRTKVMNADVVRGNGRRRLRVERSGPCGPPPTKTTNRQKTWRQQGVA